MRADVRMSVPGSLIDRSLQIEGLNLQRLPTGQ